MSNLNVSNVNGRGISDSIPTNGKDGAAWLSGTVDPVAGDGVDGDYFINTASKTVFGPKADGAWPTGFSIQGDTGPAGAKGDTGDTGATGAKGDAGPAGPDGADGSDAAVTKENIEAVLTGEITTHTHPGGSGSDAQDNTHNWNNTSTTFKPFRVGANITSLSNDRGRTGAMAFFTPYYTPMDISISELHIDVTTVGAASETAQLGVYDSNSDGFIGDLLGEVTVAIDSAGEVSATLSSTLTLSAGLYYFAHAHNSASALYLGSLNGSFISFTGVMNGASEERYGMIRSQQDYSGGLPASGALAAGLRQENYTIPVVFFS